MNLVEEIKAFFFQAMLGGWAIGGQKVVIPEMPGYKAIPFRKGNWYLLDAYCVATDSQRSAGTTTIWHRDMPVWVMHYGGSYDKTAIPILKRALLTAYSRKMWIGGRGPAKFEDGTDLRYLNEAQFNFFDRFHGSERVINSKTGITLGHHDYWGLLLA